MHKLIYYAIYCHFIAAILCVANSETVMNNNLLLPKNNLR